MVLKPKCCYGVAEVLDLLFLGSAVGSFVPNDLLLQKICLKWAELRKLWWDGCCSLPRFRESFCWEISSPGGGWIRTPARGTPYLSGLVSLASSSHEYKFGGWVSSRVGIAFGATVENFKSFLWLGRFQTRPFSSARANCNQKALLLPKIKALISENKISKFSKFQPKYWLNKLITFFLIDPGRTNSRLSFPVNRAFYARMVPRFRNWLPHQIETRIKHFSICVNVIKQL